MDPKDSLSEMLDSTMASITQLGAASTAKVLVKNSDNEDIVKLVEDRICGLLLEDSLTSEQVQLLAALLQAR